MLFCKEPETGTMYRPSWWEPAGYASSGVDHVSDLEAALI